MVILYHKKNITRISIHFSLTYWSVCHPKHIQRNFDYGKIPGIQTQVTDAIEALAKSDNKLENHLHKNLERFDKIYNIIQDIQVIYIIRFIHISTSQNVSNIIYLLVLKTNCDI